MSVCAIMSCASSLVACTLTHTHLLLLLFALLWLAAVREFVARCFDAHVSRSLSFFLQDRNVNDKFNHRTARPKTTTDHHHHVPTPDVWCGLTPLWDTYQNQSKIFYLSFFKKTGSTLIRPRQILSGSTWDRRL